MAQTTYQVTIASDDHEVAVTVAATDPETMKRAVALARQTYDELVAQPEQSPEQKQEDTPICPVHNAPMVHRNGKFGEFWSCQKRTPDGKFCSYRPNGR